MQSHISNKTPIKLADRSGEENSPLWSLCFACCNSLFAGFSTDHNTQPVLPDFLISLHSKQQIMNPIKTFEKQSLELSPAELHNTSIQCINISLYLESGVCKSCWTLLLCHCLFSAHVLAECSLRQKMLMCICLNLYSSQLKISCF